MREYQILVARHDAPVKTFDDAFKTELLVGGSGGATDTFPIITNAVLGTKFKVITGYPGTREVNLAMDRNEVQGNGAITWASIKSTMTAMLAEKRSTSSSNSVSRTIPTCRRCRTRSNTPPPATKGMP